MGYWFGFDFSIFQYLFVSLITILNPWQMIGDDTKTSIINKTIQASVQILRAYEIETTYEKIEINTMSDTVTIKDIDFIYYLKDNSEICNYDNMVTSDYLDFKDFYGCPVHVNLESLEIGGLFSKDQNSFKSKLSFKNLSLDSKIFDNNAEAKAIKKLLDINDKISVNLEYDTEYLFNKNKFELAIFFEIIDNIRISLNTSLSRINLPITYDYGDEEIFKIKFTINKFGIKITDEGLIENVNLISELNNQPQISDMFISLLDMDQEELRMAKKGSKNYILKNIHSFLLNSGAIMCQNSNILTFEGYDFIYGDTREIESTVWQLCNDIQTGF